MFATTNQPMYGVKFPDVIDKTHYDLPTFSSKLRDDVFDEFEMMPCNLKNAIYYRRGVRIAWYQEDKLPNLELSTLLCQDRAIAQEMGLVRSNANQVEVDGSGPWFALSERGRAIREWIIKKFKIEVIDFFREFGLINGKGYTIWIDNQISIEPCQEEKHVETIIVQNLSQSEPEYSSDVVRRDEQNSFPELEELIYDEVTTCFDSNRENKIAITQYPDNLLDRTESGFICCYCRIAASHPKRGWAPLGMNIDPCDIKDRVLMCLVCLRFGKEYWR